MKKTFGIIGAGNIGQAVAAHLLKAGYPVLLSHSSDPDSLKEVISHLGPGARAVSAAEAASADFVLLAILWTQVSTLTGLTDWTNRIVIDAMNQFVTHAPEFTIADLGGRPSSQVMTEYLPGARVVKAFNTLRAATLAADPKQAGGQRVLFISGDDVPAKLAVRQVIETLGFSVIDLGSLVDGSKYQHPREAFAAVNLIQLA